MHINVCILQEFNSKRNNVLLVKMSKNKLKKNYMFKNKIISLFKVKKSQLLYELTSRFHTNNEDHNITITPIKWPSILASSSSR